MALTAHQKSVIEANRRKALERLKQRGITKPGSNNGNIVTKNSDSILTANAKAEAVPQESTSLIERTVQENASTSAELSKQSAQSLRDASLSPNVVFSMNARHFTDKSPNVASKEVVKLRPTIRKKDYIEYDLSTMKNTYGGFINSNDDNDVANYESNSTSKKEQSLEEWKREQRERRSLYEDAPPPEHISLAPKCTECQINIEMDPIMKDIFHLKVCKTCVKAHPEKFSLLTKTECKEDYFLTDPELNDTSLFDRLEKPNPHSGTFARMQLFVRCKIEEFAFNKWGGERGLDEEWQRREEGKVSRREKKYHKMLKEMRLKTRAQEYTNRLKELKHGKGHVHEFGAPVDGGNNQDGIPVHKRKCVGCDLEIEEIML
ncbi:DNA repair protein RAD14 Ecym_2122 [Eremothecium cymbalariae DBVPG|uniref:XPA C-terminal domain-containing protein n=1 Tax=Eremothecium cymbalariae (strain CBS 270.75 / DBVPG 7215 / KCTC 17166 / NRRL Y-17582) TaxID=931890 RepID=G8JPM6_ERECY|nr:Hypothetical protein Ecym_2122 [Eremothecium cymbalariae DBVPG\